MRHKSRRNGARSLRVSGTLGTLEWWQEEPNRLAHFPLDGPACLLTRGAPRLHASALRASRLPPGHPEGFIEAFANVYLGVAAAIRAHGRGERRPIRWRPTIPAWKPARAACAS